MASGKVCRAESAIMQGGRQQRAGRAGLGQGGQVGRPAHAARRVKPLFRSKHPQGRQTRQIRAPTAAHAFQVHHDQVIGPGYGLLKQIRRPKECLATKIQGEDAARRRSQRTGGIQAFTAQYRPPQFKRPGGDLPGIARAAIHPEFESRMRGAKRGDLAAMIAAPQNRVQIGDVTVLERIQPQQSVQNVCRMARWAQGGDKWTVAVTPTFPGMHHLAGHQIEHGNEP